MQGKKPLTFDDNVQELCAPNSWIGNIYRIMSVGSVRGYQHNLNIV